MKLELKHLSGYLPYGLKMYWEDNQNRPQESWVLKCDAVYFVLNNQNKPILHPLSDLTKEIEVNGKLFVPMARLAGLFHMNVIEYCHIEQNPHLILETARFVVIQKLLEWHFDIYGLIKNNLAIDINEITNTN